MARSLKKSRIKGLPPRVRSQVQDAITGSYGFTHKLSTDNRSGLIKIPFDDTKVVDFVSTQLSLGAGLPSGSQYLGSPELSSSLYGPGVVRKGVGDENIVINFGNGQELQPFKDDNRLEIDGKSYLTTATQSLFWASGSNPGIIGEGFEGPLWAKSSFSVDVSGDGSLTAYHSIAQKNSDTPFVYYNFSSRLYSQVGAGHGVHRLFSGALGHTQYFDENCLGFAPSMRSYLTTDINGLSETINSSSHYNAGLPIDSFGFPWHHKYFVSKDSPCLSPLSATLPAPFLLEKIVVDFSASFEDGGFNYGSKTPVVCTFFILNQKRSGKISEVRSIPLIEEWGNAGAYPSTFSPSYFHETISSSHQFGIMDLVGVMRVGWIPPSDFSTGALTNENRHMFDVVSNNSTNSWDFDTKGEVVLKSPSKNLGCSSILLNSNNKIEKYILQASYGGRNGMFQACSRNKIEPFGISRPIVNASFLTSGSTYSDPSIEGNGYFSSNGRNSWIINPYLLMPTDELIFGWQTSTVDEIGIVDPAYGVYSFWKDHLSGSLLKVGKCIVTFYGSFVRNGREYHDTLNQLVSSQTIHGVIE